MRTAAFGALILSAAAMAAVAGTDADVRARPVAVRLEEIKFLCSE